MSISKITFPVIFFVLFSLVSFAQNATFVIDTSDSRNSSGRLTATNEYLKDMEWKVNGKTLNYKIGKVDVAINPNRLDTLFYKQRPNANWDTILFHATAARTYQLMFNACCGGFDITDETGELIHGQVRFRISSKTRNKTYLGTLGEAGIIVSNKNPKVLKQACRSAMAPNIYQITLSEITTCRDTIDCTEEICLSEKGKEEPNYSFRYKTIATKFNFLYMPLSDEPIQIVYDPKSNKYGIESN